MTKKNSKDFQQLDLLLPSEQKVPPPFVTANKVEATPGAPESAQVAHLSERRYAKLDGRALETVLKFASTLGRRLT